MDLHSSEGLNDVHPCVYRAAMKLQSLQKHCHMDVVSIQHIMEALNSEIGAQQQQQEVGLNKEEVTVTLKRMFDSLGHVTAAAAEETCSLMFRLYDRSQTGRVSAASLQTALIALSADDLQTKYRALLRLSENRSGSISRSGLRSLLQDLSQVPVAVQEEVVFGRVDVAVSSCFNGVLIPTVREKHVLSWLQGEPRLLLWLPTLYRLSVAQNVSHMVRCYTCKTFPITGLRYRCMKCVNVHMCQSCFLIDQQTGKHKTHHPVVAFCSQPTWKESLSSLVHSACYILLPRRHTRRETGRRRVLMWAEPGETLNSGPPPSEGSTQLAESAVGHSPPSDTVVFIDASAGHPPSSSKALQTDEETPTQQVNSDRLKIIKTNTDDDVVDQTEPVTLLTEVRNLHRDKWLLEQELQALRLTMQSEHGVLEDRCSEMEFTVEMLREHHLCLQGMLTQALNKMEAQQHANNIPQSRNITPTSDTLRNSDKDDEEEEEDQQQTPSTTMHGDTPPSQDLHWEEESPGDSSCPLIGQQDGSEVVGLQGKDCCLSEEVECCGTCSPEELLQETVNRLKAVMETDRWRETHETQTGERKKAELLEAADQVGESIHHLVDAVRTNAT